MAYPVAEGREHVPPCPQLRDVLLEVFGRDEKVPRIASQRNACNAVVVEGQWWIRVLQAFSLLGGAEEVRALVDCRQAATTRRNPAGRRQARLGRVARTGVDVLFSLQSWRLIHDENR